MLLQEQAEKEICSVRYQEALMQQAQAFYKLQESARFDLSNSNTEALVLSELLGSAPAEREDFFALKLNYGHPQGQETLLNALAALYTGIPSERILVEEGSEEALLLLLQCLLDPSDHLILQFPCYPPALEIAVNRNEQQVSLWSGHITPDGWRWPLDELESLLERNTKAVFLCSPHNPTGSVMSRAEYAELIEFAREHNLLLICDEVYRFLEYDEEDRLPPMAECYEQGISIGSLSKAFALPGLRTGWIALNDDELKSRLISYKSRTTLCNSLVTQYLAESALQKKASILSAVNGQIQQNRQLLQGFMQDYAELFEWVEPKAGTVAFLSLRNYEDADKFCRTLANEASVLCLPGSLFSYESHFFRVGFGKADFKDALAAFRGFLDRG